MTKHLSLSCTLGLLSLIFALLGCSQMKASPREKTSAFLSHGAEMKNMPERYPFQKVWVAETLAGKNRKHYSKIYIAPVDISHLDTKTWKVRFRDVASNPEDVAIMAEYLRTEFAKAIEQWPNSVVEVIDPNDGSPDAVILELAIVELVPTATVQKAASTIAGLFLTGGGALAVASSGSIAIEGKVSDAASGKVIGEFADREMDKSAPIDIAGFKWYSRSKENIDDWAQQFAELANTTPEETVADSLPFTLMPF